MGIILQMYLHHEICVLIITRLILTPQTDTSYVLGLATRIVIRERLK
jgi:hypothetical protein